MKQFHRLSDDSASPPPQDKWLNACLWKNTELLPSFPTVKTVSPERISNESSVHYHPGSGDRTAAHTRNTSYPYAF